MRVLLTLGKPLIRFGMMGFSIRLSKINVQGKFYCLIKSLYSKSTCSVRIGNNKTRSFQRKRSAARLHFKPSALQLIL